MIIKRLFYRKCTQVDQMLVWFVFHLVIPTPTACPDKTTSGQCCSIPFSYKGVTYNNCTQVDHHRPWCSLDPVYKGRWGNCRKFTPYKLVFVDYKIFLFLKKLSFVDELNRSIASVYELFLHQDNVMKKKIARLTHEVASYKKHPKYMQLRLIGKTGGEKDAIAGIGICQA